jgi:DNA-directed RNA polymerase specialized sigma24 family protein
MARMAQSDLRRIRTKAARLRKAEQELADAILQAHAAGESYRDIAPFAGLNYSRVYQLARARRRELDEQG